jgi:thiol-disulfide isomerase/thioredoxin
MIDRTNVPALRTTARGALVPLVALAFSLAGAVTPLAGAVAPLAAQEMGIEIGAKGPDAALETLDSATVKLSSVITGKPAVIYFWATWCSNCRELEPAMNAAFEKHGASVAFAAIAVSVNQSTERVRRYTAQHYIGWKHFYDRRGNGVEVYDVPATSYVVVLDRAGKVVYTGTGGKQDIEAAIQKALK